MTVQPPRLRVSRRRLLVTGAAALAAGAAATEGANLATGARASATGADLPPPDVDLMAEHGVLKRLLLVYQNAADRIAAGQPPPTSAIHDAATIIHDFIESFHEALEEGYVFPTLKAAGQLVPTVETLLLQHGRGRLLTQLILDGTTGALDAPSTRGRVVAAMAAFTRMYQPHEAREDTAVFPAFRRLCTPAQLEDYASAFATLQDRQFGSHGFTDTVGHVAAIEQQLGIYDLSQFTPAAVTP